MRRLLIAFIFLQAGYLSASLRSGTDTTLSPGYCPFVEGAKKRLNPFVLKMCYCAAPGAVLNWHCGPQRGERKFDVTLNINIGPRCKCSAVPGAAYVAVPARKARSDEDSTEVTESESDGEETEKENACARWGAVPRTGTFHKGCKCEEDWALSSDCGKLSLLRKFRPKDKDVQNSHCRCVKDEELSRDEKLIGATVPVQKIDPPEDRSQVAKASEASEASEASPQTEITCKKPPPEPFKFGDIVRIEKKVHVGYRYEFAGIGIGAQYKEAKISGTIAQVVCSGETAAVEGRVCLRKGAKGSASVGCWPVENLVKLDG